MQGTALRNEIEARLDAVYANGDDSAPNYVLVRQTFEPADRGAMGRIIAESTGAALADVTDGIADSQGILTAILPRGIVAETARRLQAAGYPVTAIRADQFVGHPPPHGVVGGVVAESGLTVRHENREETIPWGSLFGITGGMFKESGGKIVKTTSSGMSAVSNMVLAQAAAQGTVPGRLGGVMVANDIQRREKLIVPKATEEQFVDLFFRDPWRCIRIRKNWTDAFKIPDFGEAAFGDRWLRLVAWLLYYGGDAPVTDGVFDFVRKGVIDRDARFEDERQVVLTNSWVLQLWAWDRI
jgi:hypothetical protein